MFGDTLQRKNGKGFNHTVVQHKVGNTYYPWDHNGIFLPIMKIL